MYVLESARLTDQNNWIHSYSLVIGTIMCIFIRITCNFCLLSGMYVCLFVYMFGPKVINNYSHEMKPDLLVKQAFLLLYMTLAINTIDGRSLNKK